MLPLHMDLPVLFTKSKVVFPKFKVVVVLDHKPNLGLRSFKGRLFYALLAYKVEEEHASVTHVKNPFISYGTVVLVTKIFCDRNKDVNAEMLGMSVCEIVELDERQAYVRLFVSEKGSMKELFPDKYEELVKYLVQMEDFGVYALKKLESLDACFFCDFCFGTLPIDFRTAVSCLATRDLTGRVEQAVSLIRKYVKFKIPMKITADNAIASSKEEEPGMNRNGSDAKPEGSQDKDKDSKLCTNDSNKAGKLLGPEVPESEKKIAPYLDNSSKEKRLRMKLERLVLPEETREQIMHDLETMEALKRNNSMEYYNLRNYLEFVADLPWNMLTADRTDFENAREELEKSHEGMVKVKQRILEYLAVRQLHKTNLKGPILCLVGPPGVGKTSIAKAVAKATGRKFVRIALGGVRDDAEIRGHRRTYVGAMPGRIIHGMKVAKSRNPVVVLDEIDKLGPRNIHGDPASALLEVLDAEQNSSFHDHYLNVPFDLSQVMFIATANDVKYVPPALYDRLEIVKMDGYSTEEKVTIAVNYIIPRQLEDHGIAAERFHMEAPVIRKLVEEYTLEAGVRQLERAIAAVCRHVAVQLVERMQKDIDSLTKTAYPIIITESILEVVLHDQRHHQKDFDRRRRNNRPGTSFGLGANAYGGVVQIVEVSKSKGKGKVVMTGCLGDVLKESVGVVITWIKSNGYRFGISAAVMDEVDLHVHIPAGGVSKDGPSAGSSLLLAILSLLTGRLVRTDTAVTGEMTLSGDILPVGAVKQKVLAAHRATIARVILPSANELDAVELPDDVKKTMEIVFVKTADELLKEALEDNMDLLSKL